ncbi:unnamed protein product [Closterium sp. NIES-53]
MHDVIVTYFATLLAAYQWEGRCLPGATNHARTLRGREPMIHSKRGELYLGEQEAEPREDLLDHMRLRQRNGASCPVPGDLHAEVAQQLTKVSASVSPLQFLLHGGQTPALPSPTAAVTPLHSPAAFVTAPAATGGTPALPFPGAAMTPPLLSPAAAATAPAAAVVTPPLLPLAAAMTPPLLSPAAASKIALAATAIGTAPAAAFAATATAAVPSQTAHAPPSPTGGDAAHGSGKIQCAV